MKSVASISWGNGSAGIPLGVSGDGRVVLLRDTRAGYRTTVLVDRVTGQTRAVPFGGVFSDDARRITALPVIADLGAGLIYEYPVSALVPAGWQITQTLDTSADGRIVAFEAVFTAENIRDLFVIDTATGVVTRPSRSVNPSASGGAAGASVTPDGRYVVWAYAADRGACGEARCGEIWRLDRQTGEHLLVSTNAFGEESVGRDHSPSISADGTRIVWVGQRNANLGTFADGSQFGGRVYAKDLVNGGVIDAGAFADGGGPQISDDGQRVLRSRRSRQTTISKRGWSISPHGGCSWAGTARRPA